MTDWEEFSKSFMNQTDRAWDSFLQIYGNWLFAVLRKNRISPDDEEDILSALCIRLIVGVAKGKVSLEYGEKAFRQYLLVGLKIAIADHYRLFRNSEKAFNEYEGYLVKYGNNSNPVGERNINFQKLNDDIVNLIDAKNIWKNVDRIVDEKENAILHFYFLGYDDKSTINKLAEREISPSHSQKWTAANVRKTRERAIKKVRKQILTR